MVWYALLIKNVRSLVFDKKKKQKKTHNIFISKDSSLQENVLFQSSKILWELFFLSFSVKNEKIQNETNFLCLYFRWFYTDCYVLMKTL